MAVFAKEWFSGFCGNFRLVRDTNDRVSLPPKTQETRGVKHEEESIHAGMGERRVRLWFPAGLKFWRGLVALAFWWSWASPLEAPT